MRCKLSPNDPDHDDSFDDWYEAKVALLYNKVTFGERIELIEKILEIPPYGDYEYEFPHETKEANWEWFYKEHHEDYLAYMAKLLDGEWPYQSHVSEEIESALSERWF